MRAKALGLGIISVLAVGVFVIAGSNPPPAGDFDIALNVTPDPNMTVGEESTWGGTLFPFKVSQDGNEDPVDATLRGGRGTFIAIDNGTGNIVAVGNFQPDEGFDIPWTPEVQNGSLEVIVVVRGGSIQGSDGSTNPIRPQPKVIVVTVPYSAM